MVSGGGTTAGDTHDKVNPFCQLDVCCDILLVSRSRGFTRDARWESLKAFHCIDVRQSVLHADVTPITRGIYDLNDIGAVSWMNTHHSLCTRISLHFRAVSATPEGGAGLGDAAQTRAKARRIVDKRKKGDMVEYPAEHGTSKLLL